MNSLFFNKKQTRQFIKTAFGFVTYGVGSRGVYSNLYEDNTGLRELKDEAGVNHDKP